MFRDDIKKMISNNIISKKEVGELSMNSISKTEKIRNLVGNRFCRSIKKKYSKTSIEEIEILNDYKLCKVLCYFLESGGAAPLPEGCYIITICDVPEVEDLLFNFFPKQFNKSENPFLIVDYCEIVTSTSTQDAINIFRKIVQKISDINMLIDLLDYLDGRFYLRINVMEDLIMILIKKIDKMIKIKKNEIPKWMCRLLDKNVIGF